LVPSTHVGFPNEINSYTMLRTTQVTFLSRLVPIKPMVSDEKIKM
jgi:hypothetical protein